MENLQTEIIDETMPTGSFEDFMEMAPEMSDIPLDEGAPEEEELINEINQPKDPMGITIEPDDDSLQAKDLLDDEAFKFSGEMLSFGIDVGAAYLLAWIAHQPLETYRLPPKDLKKLEKVIAKCTRDTKLMLSPWQGLFVVLLAIYGMKIPQVIQARKEWEAQQLQPSNHDSEDKDLSVRDKPDRSADTAPDSNKPTATAEASDTRATVPAEPETENADE